MAAGSILLASAAQAASGTVVLTGAAPPTPTLDVSRINGLAIMLDVTVASSLVGDTLNVYLQHSLDGASDDAWDDFLSFTQVLGNGGAKRYFAQWYRDALPAATVHAQSDGALAAGVLQGPVGDDWRLKWVIAGSGTHTFTFSVTARFIHRTR